MFEEQNPLNQQINLVKYQIKYNKKQLELIIKFFILTEQSNRKIMQESLVLRQVTNIPLDNRTVVKKQSSIQTNDSGSCENEDQKVRPTLDQLLTLSTQQIDFGMCLPGSIHEKNFIITLQQQLPQPSQLSIFIFCQDETLYDDSSCLIFGVKRVGQQQYYDDYRMKIKNKRSYQFRIGVKTPLLYQYDIKCVMFISFLDYAPKAVILKQKIQIPEILCAKQLYTQEERVIKLSVVQGRGKKQCRVPFKMNHAMTISVNSQLLGLQEQKIPLIDVKPKSMTLAGKGQFSLVFTMNINDKIKQTLCMGSSFTVRRILTLKIKQTKFTYHYPVEVIYYPEPKKGGQSANQQF